MRQGYDLYSDGLFRKIFRMDKPGPCFMQVRDKDGNLLATIRGRQKILNALIGVQKGKKNEEKSAG